MSIDLKEFFMNLNIDGFFNNKINLGVSSMLSNKDISKHQLPTIDRNKNIYAYNIGRDNDIIIGEKYNILYLREDPKKYEKTDVELDFVSLKKNDNIGIIPRGYGGIIRLKFKDKIPELMKFLRQNDDEQFDKEKHKYLTFTTQEVMDKILEELEKAENA